MKKETLIAIILGITLGVIVAGSLIFTAKKNDKPKIIPIAAGLRVTPTIIKQDISPSILELTEPEQSTITTEKTITIKGKAPKGSLIIIQSSIKDFVFKNDEENFSQQVTLTRGENIFNISAYPKDGKSQPLEKQLLIYSLEEQ